MGTFAKPAAVMQLLLRLSMRMGEGQYVDLDELLYEGLTEDEVLQYVQDVRDYGFSTLQTETNPMTRAHIMQIQWTEDPAA